jgi:hypothetical protein
MRIYAQNGLILTTYNASFIIFSRVDRLTDGYDNVNINMATFTLLGLRGCPVSG